MALCSIYLIQNNIDDKIYTGQSINYDARIKRHLRIAKIGKDQRYLYQAIRKHGWDNFRSFIIEEVDLSEANKTEIFWIEYFGSWRQDVGYNLSLGGEGGIPTAETRLKMSLAKLGKSNPNMQGEKHPFYGITGEQHHRYGTHHTDEVKLIIGQLSASREHPKGSKRWNTHLTEQDVLYMREYFTSNRDMKTKDVFVFLSNKFSVGEGTVESIVYNYSWKHVKMFPVVNKNRKIVK